MKKPGIPLICIFGLLTLPICSGCSLVKSIQVTKAKDQEEAVVKKEKYFQLKKDIANHALPNQTASAVIKAKYGFPDNIFYSTSSESSFQVWTYNVSKDSLEFTDLNPILLYFNNDKLVSWKY